MDDCRGAKCQTLNVLAQGDRRRALVMLIVMSIALATNLECLARGRCGMATGVTVEFD